MNGTDHTIELRVNGKPVLETVPARMTLADLIRDRLGLTGTNIGCGEGLCGSCNVLIDGRSARACITLAVQSDGAQVLTIEGLTAEETTECFVRHAALQCGFCTPGFVILVEELLCEIDDGARLSDDEIRDRLAASICRCTGYLPIIAAVHELAAKRGVA